MLIIEEEFKVGSFGLFVVIKLETKADTLVTRIKCIIIGTGIFEQSFLVSKVLEGIIGEVCCLECHISNECDIIPVLVLPLKERLKIVLHHELSFVGRSYYCNYWHGHSRQLETVLLLTLLRNEEERAGEVLRDVVVIFDDVILVCRVVSILEEACQTIRESL